MISAIILAAGESRRMGQLKQLLPWGVTTILGQVIENVRASSIPGIYAIGDVIGGAMLAHIASAEGLVAIENALGGHKEMD